MNLISIHNACKDLIKLYSDRVSKKTLAPKIDQLITEAVARSFESLSSEDCIWLYKLCNKIVHGERAGMRRRVASETMKLFRALFPCEDILALEKAYKLDNGRDFPRNLPFLGRLANGSLFRLNYVSPLALAAFKTETQIFQLVNPKNKELWVSSEEHLKFITAMDWLEALGIKCVKGHVINRQGDAIFPRKDRLYLGQWLEDAHAHHDYKSIAEGILNILIAEREFGIKILNYQNLSELVSVTGKRVYLNQKWNAEKKFEWLETSHVHHGFISRKKYPKELAEFLRIGYQSLTPGRYESLYLAFREALEKGYYSPEDLLCADSSALLFGHYLDQIWEKTGSLPPLPYDRFQEMEDLLAYVAIFCEAIPYQRGSSFDAALDVARLLILNIPNENGSSNSELWIEQDKTYKKMLTKMLLGHLLTQENPFEFCDFFLEKLGDALDEEAQSNPRLQIGKNDGMPSTSAYFTAIFERAWIENILNMVFNTVKITPKVKIAALRAAHSACPEKKDAIIENLNAALGENSKLYKRKKKIQRVQACLANLSPEHLK